MTFTGVNPDELKRVLAEGKGDGEILEWIEANAPIKHSKDEIIAWSSQQAKRGPDADSVDFFNGLAKNCAPHRKDISTWFELLDVDDFATYGGKA